MAIAILATSVTQGGKADVKPDKKPEFALVIHGGAGTIKRKNLTPEREQAYRDKLQEVLLHGKKRLKKGASAVDVVESCIHLLEDSPLFNAGRGAVFTHDGKNELDASIMDGATLDAGAVAGVTTVRHPISAARAVMEQSPHVMMSGPGAETFARDQGLEMVDPEYFATERRKQQLQRAKQREAEQERKGEPGHGMLLSEDNDYKFGTVGVAVLDKAGNIAAGTSTGGMTNKRWGRIGDSPVIGAGTYANNATCAISCTGHGEYFIRYAVAHDISALMAYKGLSLQEAAEEVVMKKLKAAGGTGGVIGLDRQGNVTMTFNSAGMYRGYLRAGEKPVVKIFK
ncbi:MAG: isoaspartyl peptidase/L-asparaginase [Bacteroidota bacterium]